MSNQVVTDLNGVTFWINRMTLLYDKIHVSTIALPDGKILLLFKDA